MKTVQNEPVLVGVTALVAATIGLLVAFGVHLTDTQIFAITQEVEAVFGIAFLIRAKVTPTRKAPTDG